MKRATLISLFIVVAIAVAIALLINRKTSPESRLKQQFNIDISNREYSIGATSEQWLPNGDGHYYVEIILDREENIKNDLIANLFKPLPITDDVPRSEFSMNWEEVDKGYYRFGLLDSDDRNFKIAVYDSNKNKIYFYYQIN